MTKKVEKTASTDVNRPEHTCDLRDIVVLLLKEYGIHEGVWGPWVEFGIGGINLINSTTGLASPAAVVPIIKFGIQPFSEPSSMTVDAATVNRKKGKRRKK